MINDKAKVKAVMLLIQHLRQAAYRQLNGSFRRWERTTAFAGLLPKSTHGGLRQKEKATTWLSSRLLEEERSIAACAQATRVLQGARLLYLWSQRKRKQAKSYAFSLLQMNFTQPALAGQTHFRSSVARSSCGSTSITSNLQQVIAQEQQPTLNPTAVAEEAMSLWYPPVQAATESRGPAASRSSLHRTSGAGARSSTSFPTEGFDAPAPQRYSTVSGGNGATRYSMGAASMSQCPQFLSLPPPPEVPCAKPPQTPMFPESLHPPGGPQPEAVPPPQQEEGSTTDAESEQSTQTQPSSAWPPAQAESHDSLHGLAHRFDRKDVGRRATLAAQALGVKKTAGRKTVAHAFRDAARVLHPDKGGSTADFQVINEAYGLMREVHAGNG